MIQTNGYVKSLHIVYTLNLIERFSIECGETKTKVITTANEQKEKYRLKRRETRVTKSVTGSTAKKERCFFGAVKLQGVEDNFFFWLIYKFIFCLKSDNRKEKLGPHIQVSVHNNIYIDWNTISCLG